MNCAIKYVARNFNIWSNPPLGFILMYCSYFFCFCYVRDSVSKLMILAKRIIHFFCKVYHNYFKLSVWLLSEEHFRPICYSFYGLYAFSSPPRQRILHLHWGVTTSQRETLCKATESIHLGTEMFSLLLPHVWESHWKTWCASSNSRTLWQLLDVAKVRTTG